MHIVRFAHSASGRGIAIWDRPDDVVGQSDRHLNVVAKTPDMTLSHASMTSAFGTAQFSDTVTPLTVRRHMGLHPR